MTNGIAGKRCGGCGRYMMLDAFRADSKAASGCQAYCMGCKRAWADLERRGVPPDERVAELRRNPPYMDTYLLPDPQPSLFEYAE